MDSRDVDIPGILGCICTDDGFYKLIFAKAIRCRIKFVDYCSRSVIRAAINAAILVHTDVAGLTNVCDTFWS